MEINIFLDTSYTKDSGFEHCTTFEEHNFAAGLANYERSI